MMWETVEWKINNPKIKEISDFFNNNKYFFNQNLDNRKIKQEKYDSENALHS